MSSKRAVVYIRLSVHRGASDPTTSPAEQERVCRAYAAAHGWDVVEVVSDLDVSGSAKGERLQRPGLRRIRELLDDIDVVIAAKLDRISRSVSDFLRLHEELADHGVALVAIRENLDMSTPNGRFVATVLAAFAEMEAAVIAERTRSGKRAATQLRRWTGGAAPYGYRIVDHPSGRGKALAVDPDEAAHIRTAVDLILGGGTVYAAVKKLNASGSTPRKAARWAASSLGIVLRGPAIRGQVSHLGDVLRDEKTGLPEVVNEPIVTAAEAARLDELLAPTPRGHRAKAARLLSGLVRCSSCGGSMSVGSSQGVPRFACKSGDGRACPRPVTIGAEALEAHVVDEFLGAVGFFNVTELRPVEDVTRVELAAVEKAIADTAALLVEPDADVPALVERLTGLRSRREELASRERSDAFEVVDTGQRFADAWAGRDVAGRRELLASALDHVIIAPGVRGRRGFDPSRVSLVWRA